MTARVQAEYGPHAKIIAAEAVTTGGISGFFAQRHYEVTVEVPDDTAQDAHEFDLPARAGIAALLEDADNADEGPGAVVLRSTAAPPDNARPALSTASVDFQAIMADLAFNTAAPIAKTVEPAGPVPLGGAGDLIVVVGFSADAMRVARGMLGTAGEPALRVGGSIDGAGIPRVDDRRGLLAARASGVEGGYAVVVAYGLDSASVDFGTIEALRRLHSDQVWVAVDATRKEADTARWVEGVQAAVTVDGVVASGRKLTSTPDTVSAFGVPVVWE